MIALVVAWFLTRNQERVYNANTTIYTGMLTGYNLEGGSGIAGGNAQINMQNLMLIISTNNTIHEVSLRLFARCMMYGNLYKDNNYITAEHFRALDASVPPDIKALINHNSENATYANLKAHEKASQNNYLYGILNNHQYFGINNIVSRLKVAQINNSDLIDIAYSCNDPGVCYNTLDILNKVFANQYQQLRYGETHKVIKFFEREVKKYYQQLTFAENDYIRYNIKHGIINYPEQTKQLTVLDGNHQTDLSELRMKQSTTKALIRYLERQLGDRQKIIESNKEFTSLVRDISRLQSRISNLRLMSSEEGGSESEAQIELGKAERQLREATAKVKELTQTIEKNNYSTDTGVKASSLIDRWLQQVLLLEETNAQLNAMDIMRDNIDRQYRKYSPIGATIERKNRHIGFIESNYIEMLRALNAARLRQRNLQMSTATLNIVNPPAFPMNPQASGRMMYLLGAFLLTFIFTALYFFIIEMLDRTLRDRMRSERITKIPVMGCFPKESNLRYRRFNKMISDMALRQLSKVLLQYF